MEVYLDNAATTRPSKDVITEMVRASDQLYGNPSSLHSKGVEVEREIKRVRRLLARSLVCKESEIIFTSGGTEANNLAIQGFVTANKHKGNHLVTSKIEHKSVLELHRKLEKEGCRVTYLDVDSEGFISLSQLEEAITSETILVSIMHVNNEVGSIQPIRKISNIINKINPNIILHVDGVQSYGKINFTLRDLDVDSFSISGHKIHGPKGVGALYIREGLRVSPLLVGGDQEWKLRAGTENTPGIIGLGKAVDLTNENLQVNISKLVDLRKYFYDLLNEKIQRIHFNSGLTEKYSPHIINVSFLGIKSEIILHSLESDGIFVSAGSACSSKRKDYSHVLEGMNLREDYIESAIRISLSYTNTREELEYAVMKIKKHVKELRKIIGR